MFRNFSALVVLTLLAATCSASTSTTIPGSGVVIQESINFVTLNGGEIPSIDGLGDADNITLSATLAGGYNLTGTTYSGTIRGEGNNWLAEASVSATHPMGSYTLTAFPVSSTSGPATTESFDEITGATGPFELDGGFDPAGLTDFEFYDTSVDNPDAADTTWEALTVDFWGEVTPPVTTVTDGMFSLGAIPQDGTKVLGPGQDGNAFHTDVVGGLDFFTFDIGNVGAAGSYLNIQTIDPVTGDTIDTEMGLYDSAGMLVGSDDDGQTTTLGGLYSLLTFGADDPLSGDNTAGADGASLAAGSYTLVVGPFDATYAALLADVTPGTSSAASRAGDYELSITHVVPEPSSVLLLLIGFVGFLSTRR